MNDTPAPAVDKNSHGTEIITDSAGRKLTYKQLSAMEFGRFLRAAGDHSNNSGFLQYASVALSVRAIDGVPGVFPTNMAMIDAAMDRLGDDGYQCVFEWAAKQAEANDADAQAAKN